MAVVLDKVTLSYADLRGRPQGFCRRRKQAEGRALNGVSLRADRGSIYGLLGPSGCGKTSVLSCCLGVCRPTTGRALVLGRAPASPAAGVPGPDVGYMPQTVSLHSFLTPAELLRYYGTIFGVDGLDSRVQEMLDLVEINDGKINKRQVDRLSGGERRRVSLACALVHKPPLIIL